MIIPSNHFDSDGNIVFELSHLSENPKEQKKGVFDCKQYKNWITVDPLLDIIVDKECECYDFIVNKASSESCKHLRESIAIINNYLGCNGM